MVLQESGPLWVHGQQLDEEVAAVGELRRSAFGAGAAAQLTSDGYLFLPGFFPRADVMAARAELVADLRREGYAGASEGEEVRPGASTSRGVQSEVAKRSPALQALLYGGRTIGLFESILGGSVRPFDFTWLRAVPPGPGTKAHMDTVFMNRGSRRLLTAWTPLGDVPLRMGGVAILEGSHTSAALQEGYADRDVDTYCEDQADASAMKERESMVWSGQLEGEPETLRRTARSRWLTSDYRAGDLLVFTILTAHVGLDNHSEYLRLSCDSRYQPAEDPIDGRWVGADPSAHGARSKVGIIC